MTNNYKIARFATLLLVFFAFLTQSAKAQLFTDQFNYTSTGTLAGDSLIKISGTTSGPSGNSVWKGHSGYVTGVPTNPQLQTATSLTYATYPTVGGAVSFTNTGLDVNATFAAQTTGSVYASAIVSLSAAQATGDYFLHLGQTSATQTWNINTTFLNARVYAKSSGAGFQLGFARSSGTATYGATVYPFGTPIFIVIKYNFVAGATNDTASMYVFTTGLPPTIEPIPDFTEGGTAADPTELSKIAIRQGTAANAPTGLIDYVRVGTAWADVTSAPATSAPSIAITQGATAIPTANTPAFSMGSVATSTDLDVTFTITNAGTAPLTLTPATITGTGYSILTQPTSPVANGASNTTTFVVRFNSATAVAGALGTVTIGNNANTSYVVNLSATATAPAAPIIVVTRGAAIPVPNLSSVNLGSTPINTNLDITFTITNTGNAPLIMNVPLNIASVGNVYSIITQPAASIPNGVGNTSTITVRLNSPAVNSLTLGALSLSNNSGGSTGGFFIDLSADVTAVASPNIAVTQAATAVPSGNIFNPFDMGTTPTNTNLDVTFTVTNTGAAALGITTPLTVSGAGYSIFTQPAVSVPNVAPNNTTTFVVRFNSTTAVANVAGIVTIINTTGTNYVINLLATATATGTPVIAISQGATAIPTANTPAFVMGSIAIGSNLDATFTITNTGTAPLTLTTPITITGTGYSIFTQPTSPVANGASNTTTFVVRFNSATTVANALGTVTIGNNANTSYVVNLSATTTGTPSINITQTAITIASNNTPAFNMGSILTGLNLDKSFVITNAGTAPLAFTTPITITGTGYSILTQPTSPVTNGAGNTTIFVVRFNSATAVAGVAGVVTIVNNAGADYVINLVSTATTTVPVNPADYEPFLQASGAVVTTNGWVSHSGTAGQIVINTGSLNYPTLATASGNKISTIAGNSEDINKAVTPLSFIGYYSAVVQLPNTTGLTVNTLNGDYCMAFGASAGASTGNLVGRLFFRQGTLPNTFNIGLLNNSGGVTTPTYAPTDYAINTPIFVVVEYVGASGAANLWINPTTGLTTAPAFTITNNGSATPPIANLGSIVIRQGFITPTAPATISPGNTGNVEIDEIRVGDNWASVTPGVSTSPTLTVNPTSLAFGNILAGANSIAQSYVLTGANLTNDVTITAPAEFAISTTSTGTYGTTLTYTVAQMATPQTVFVRASPLTAGAKTGNITHASTGVTATPSVALTATGTSAPPAPSLTVSPASRAFGNVIVGTNSVEQSYVLTGTSLTNDVTITAPAEFAISTTATGTFTSTLTFTVAQMTTPQTVFVRASPLTVGAKTGNITHASIGVATLPTVALTATGIIPTLTVAPTSLDLGDVAVAGNSAPRSYVLTGTTLTSPVTVTAPAEFAISSVATGLYTTTLTFTVAQMGSTQTIFVRASPTTLGAKTGNITHASTGVAVLPTVALTANSVLSNITAGPDLVFGTVSTGAVSEVKTFVVQGTSLTADLVVTAPTNFQVSKDGITFAATANFTAAEVSTVGVGKNVSVRFAPTSGVSGLKNAAITVTSVGSLTKNVNVSGTETSPTTALDNSFAKEVVIYPNPTQTSFQIKLPTNGKNYVIELVDITGKVILTKKSDEVISVENLQKGFYIVKFSNAERTFTKKISIN